MLRIVQKRRTSNHTRFKSHTLQITHASNEGVGYDEAAYPEMLCSFKNTRTGEDVPCSLYEYEFEIVAKPKKTVEKSFYQMVYDHIVQNGFELKRDFDMDTYHFLTFNKGNVNVSFELPNKGKKIKSQVCGVYFQLEDAHNKRFSNGHWKYNFHEFSHMDKNEMFENFINHFDAAMVAA